jgi:hypothetical protein
MAAEGVSIKSLIDLLVAILNHPATRAIIAHLIGRAAEAAQRRAQERHTQERKTTGTSHRTRVATDATRRARNQNAETTVRNFRSQLAQKKK